MAKRFSNRNPGIPWLGAVFAIAAVLLAILDRDNLFTRTDYIGPICFWLLVLAISLSFHSPWYTDIDCDDEGIAIVHGRGRGRKIRWTDVTALEWRKEKRWVTSKHPYLKVSRILTLRLQAGKPLVLRNMEPHSQVEILLGARLKHLAASPHATRRTVVLDGTTLFDGAQARGSTITTLVVIVGLCTLSGHYARVEATDAKWWWWVLTFLPAGLLAPLALLLAWGEFGQPAYSLSSSGNTFTVVRRRHRREETTSGQWSNISETRYEIEKSPRQRDFAVEVGSKRFVYHAGEYPELIAWFNERAPLDYEWIPVKSVGDRRVAEKIGDYARVDKN